MDPRIRDYLAEIGRRGGRASRRALASDDARAMVAVREARRAYRRFYAQCFWSYAPDLRVTSTDVPWVAEQLRRHGGREAWDVAARLVPLTALQATLGRILAANRSEDSYLGAAPLLAEPNTQRYSQDLDYFHDSPERVASAFDVDRRTLLAGGYAVEAELSQPGYIRAVVRKGEQATKVEWAHDSSWRFMPVMRSEQFGYQLHPIDLALNKVLALAGRDEPRDLIDVLDCHRRILELGPLVWAAAGKDPGFSPLSLLDLLRRRGKVRPEDLSRLHVVTPLDLAALKVEWLSALAAAEAFVRSRRPEEVGCLYYAPVQKRFVDPSREGVGEVVAHFGRPGGVLPRILES